jgi:hypothetical protein
MQNLEGSNGVYKLADLHIWGASLHTRNLTRKLVWRKASQACRITLSFTREEGQHQPRDRRHTFNLSSTSPRLLKLGETTIEREKCLSGQLHTLDHGIALPLVPCRPSLTSGSQMYPQRYLRQDVSRFQEQGP